MLRVFGVRNSEMRIRNSELGIRNFELRIPHSAFRTPHSAFRTPHSELRIQDAKTIRIVGPSMLPPLIITPTLPCAATFPLNSAATPSAPDGSTTSFMR